MAWLGWATGAIFFFYAWVLRVSPSVMVDELMAEFAVSGAVLGNLSALYFYGYAGMQIPVGLLLDRFGPRRLMTIAALVCVGGGLLFASSRGMAEASAGRFLIGVGSAFSLAGTLAIAGQSFPVSRFALLSGLAMMMGMLGGVFGQAPLRHVVDASGWREALMWVSAAGVLMAFACFAFVRDRRRGSGGIVTVLNGLAVVARNRQVWLNALVGLGATGPLLGFAGLWGVPFLQTAYEIEQTQAAGMTSLLLIGWALGAPIMGWFSDRLGRRKPPLYLGLLVAMLALTGIVSAPLLPAGVVSVLCLVVGLGGSAQIVNFALTREAIGPSLSGTAIGLVNGMITGAGALFQPLIGWLLDLQWDGQMSAGSRIYDVASYRLALCALLVGMAAALVCSLFLSETPVDGD